MRSSIIRRSIAGAVFVLMTSPLLRAQATPPLKVDSFTGTTVNLNPGAGIPLRITVFKWATDTERDALLAVLKEKGDSGLGAGLEKTPTAGYIWDEGPLGYSLRYAQKIQQPDGGERIILLTDRPLGSWSREGWKPSGQNAARPYSFTLVELRLNKHGPWRWQDVTGCEGDGRHRRKNGDVGELRSRARPNRRRETRWVELAHYAAVQIRDARVPWVIGSCAYRPSSEAMRGRTPSSSLKKLTRTR